jgi:hypothetical protein
MKRLLAGALVAMAIPSVSHAVPAIMAVYEVRADRDGVTIQAPVQGLASCTPTRQNLTMAISKEAGGVTLLVAPRGAAECRAKGGPAEVHWRYEELGLQPGQPFSVANPLVMAP